MVENANGGACEAERLVEVSAKKLIHALDHVPDNFFRGIPDTKFFAKVGVESFEEGLVEVRNGLVFTEGVEESGLNPVERFTREVENLLKLDGIQRPGVGHFAKKLAEDGDAKVVSGDTPVETRARGARFGAATPQNPGRENTVKESLNQSRTKKVLP